MERKEVMVEGKWNGGEERGMQRGPSIVGMRIEEKTVWEHMGVMCLRVTHILIGGQSIC